MILSGLFQLVTEHDVTAALRMELLCETGLN